MSEKQRIVLCLSIDEYEYIVKMATEKMLSISELVMLAVIALESPYSTLNSQI